MYVVFLLFILLSYGITYLYLQKQIFSQKKQLLFLTSKNNSKLIAKFEQSEYKFAYTKEATSINLAPLEDYQYMSIGSIGKATTVNILKQATINDSTWYYVKIPSTDNCNNQGWIKATTLIFDETKSH